MRALLASFAVMILVGCGSSEKTTPGTGGSGSSETGGSGGNTGGSVAGTGGAVAGTGGGGAAADAATSAPDSAVSPDTASTTDTAASADTWESFAKGFFASFCVSCHDDDKKGVAARDYHLLANVMKEKAEIACGVASSQAAWAQRHCTGFPPARQFPVGNGPKPTDAERDRLLRWIDANTP